MREELKEPDDSVRVGERIKKLRTQHLDDLQRLYAAHAAEYHEEMLHRHRSKDETLQKYLDSGESDRTYEQLQVWSQSKIFFEMTDHCSQGLYRDTRNAACYELQWHDDIARMNYACQQELSQLRQRKKNLRQREEEERIREEAQFPRNMADWRSKPKNVQLRVARFLTLSDKPKQERMLNDFGWAWRQVQPLVDEYHGSVSRIVVLVAIPKTCRP
jgi:hypothetical protein